MKLRLKDHYNNVEIDRLPAYLLIDEHGWLDVHYDMDSANQARNGSREGGTDCTIYTLEQANSTED